MISAAIDLHCGGRRRHIIEAEAAFAHFLLVVVMLAGGQDAGAAKIADDLAHIVPVHHGQAAEIVLEHLGDGIVQRFIAAKLQSCGG